MSKLSQVHSSVAYYLTRPIVRLLARTSITPSTITWLGFLLAVGAATLIVTEHLFTAGLAVLVASFFDILDGALARHTNQTTRFGGVLDSFLDRVSEAVLLFGILVLYARDQSLAPVLIVFVALVGSLLVSYMRARAEAMGLECKVGIFTRAERVIVLALGLLVNQVVIALMIIAVFSFITVGQRLTHVWRQTKVK